MIRKNNVISRLYRVEHVKFKMSIRLVKCCVLAKQKGNIFLYNHILRLKLLLC